MDSTRDATPHEIDTPRRAIFLDRDGTLIHDPGYLDDPDGVVVLPGVVDALRAFSDAGLERIIVTNQSGIARGRYSVDRYEQVAARVLQAFDELGVTFLATYYCPYHPDGTVAPFNTNHPDRKPGDGMWHRAAREHGIDLAHSWSIGDGERDIVAGKRAGTRSILLAAARDKWPLPVGGPFDPDFVARDMREASLFLLRELGYALPTAPGDPISI